MLAAWGNCLWPADSTARQCVAFAEEHFRGGTSCIEKGEDAMTAAVRATTQSTTAKQIQIDSRASERQVARLIGLTMGVSFVLVMALYAVVL